MHPVRTGARRRLGLQPHKTNNKNTNKNTNNIDKDKNDSNGENSDGNAIDEAGAAPTQEMRKLPSAAATAPRRRRRLGSARPPRPQQLQQLQLSQQSKSTQKLPIPKQKSTKSNAATPADDPPTQIILPMKRPLPPTFAETEIESETDPATQPVAESEANPPNEPQPVSQNQPKEQIPDQPRQQTEEQPKEQILLSPQRHATTPPPAVETPLHLDQIQKDNDKVIHNDKNDDNVIQNINDDNDDKQIQNDIDDLQDAPPPLRPPPASQPPAIAAVQDPFATPMRPSAQPSSPKLLSLSQPAPRISNTSVSARSITKIASYFAGFVGNALPDNRNGFARNRTCSAGGSIPAIASESAQSLSRRRPSAALSLFASRSTGKRFSKSQSSPLSSSSAAKSLIPSTSLSMPLKDQEPAGDGISDFASSSDDDVRCRPRRRCTGTDALNNETDDSDTQSQLDGHPDSIHQRRLRCHDGPDDILVGGSIDALIGRVSANPLAPTQSPARDARTGARDVEYQQRVYETQLWVDKYRPANEAELAVHKRKVRDVREWLARALSGQRGAAPNRHRHSYPAGPSSSDNACSGQILVLTGPSGAGKTATIRALARELNAEIVEWANPVNVNSFQSVWERHTNSDESGKQEKWGADYVPVLARFLDFVSSSCRVPALSLTIAPSPASASTPQSSVFRSSRPATRRKIVFIEDWPQLGSPKSRADVHRALRMCLQSNSSVYALVLIISDVSDVHNTGNDGGSFGYRDGRFSDAPATLRAIVPPDIIASPKCTVIAFNPVAPTILIKALNCIAAIEFRSPAKRARRPSKTVLEWVARSSAGDIRHAINRLQFLALVDQKTVPRGMHIASASMPSGGSGAKKRGGRGSSSNNSGRDSATFAWSSPNKPMESSGSFQHAMTQPSGGWSQAFQKHAGFTTPSSQMTVSSTAAPLAAASDAASAAIAAVRMGHSSGSRAALFDADCRDETLSIFQAVGRIRYNKRLEIVPPAESMLASHLVSRQCSRAMLEIEPESIVSNLHVDTDLFTAFLEQNCVPAYTTLDEVVAATQYLSDADAILSGSWESKRHLSGYAASICTRGLLFAHRQTPAARSISNTNSDSTATDMNRNTSAATHNMFEHLKKPELWAARKRAQDHRETTQNGLVRVWIEKYMRRREKGVDFGDDSLAAFAKTGAGDGFVLAHTHTDAVLWRETLPFLGVLGRTNRHAGIRALPIHAKTAIASICGYGYRALTDSLVEGSVAGGIEYLDAIEDSADPSFTNFSNGGSSSGRTPSHAMDPNNPDHHASNPAYTSTQNTLQLAKASHLRYETLALVDDDIQDF